MVLIVTVVYFQPMSLFKKKEKHVQNKKENLVNEREITFMYLAWFSRSLASARRSADRWTIAASYRAQGTRYWSSSISSSLAHNRTITGCNRIIHMLQVPKQTKATVAKFMYYAILMKIFSLNVRSEFSMRLYVPTHNCMPVNVKTIEHDVQNWIIVLHCM